MTATTTSDLMSAQDVADYLQMPLQTLYVWRGQGRGPRAIRVGSRLRYRRSEVDAWLNENTETSPGAA